MSEQQLVLMRMPLGPLGTNCYVIGDKAIGEAFIIDPATAEVLDALKKHDLKPKAIVLTHGHGDHIGGIQEIVNIYHGADLTQNLTHLFCHQIRPTSKRLEKCSSKNGKKSLENIRITCLIASMKWNYQLTPMI